MEHSIKHLSLHDIRQNDYAFISPDGDILILIQIGVGKHTLLHLEDSNRFSEHVWMSGKDEELFFEYLNTTEIVVIKFDVKKHIPKNSEALKVLWGKK